MENRLLISWMMAVITWISSPGSLHSEACSSDVLKVQPSNVVPVGSRVTISCTLTNYQGVKILNMKTGRTWENQWGTSIITEDTSLVPGIVMYRCDSGTKVICGDYVHFGFLPDQAQNLSCEQEGESGNVSCSWLLERDSGIHTTCDLHLQIGQNRSITRHVGVCTNGIFSVTLPEVVERGEEYAAQVETRNDLGTNVSKLYHFSFYDVVKPHPPSNITINCDHRDECLVTVHTSGDIQHIKLCYRAVDERDCQEVENPTNNTFTLHRLQPVTQYYFQAACKYRTNRGKWSPWCNAVTIVTPESIPRVEIDLWYKLHNATKTTWNITLYWKVVNASQVRGQIRHYQLTFQLLNQERPPFIHNTTDTCFTKAIEVGEYVIAVSAHNSKGNSAPTLIRVSTQDHSVLPAPTNVIAAASDPGHSVKLTWEPPAGRRSLDAYQIVEWSNPTEDPSCRTWEKIARFNRSIVISENIQPYTCYRFRVFFLQEGRAGVSAVTMASLQQRAPQMALKFNTDIKRDRVLVIWREIPSEEQMGCILHYTIYLKDSTRRRIRQIKIPSTQSPTYQYEIDHLNSSGLYKLWMTFTNEVGETLTWQDIYFQLDGTQGEEDLFYLIALAIFGMLSLAIILIIRKRTLSRTLPWCCIKAVPDPANCEWAKECMSDKDKLRDLHRFPSSTSDCNDTDTLEVESISSEEECHFCATYIINTLHAIEPKEIKMDIQDISEVPQPCLASSEAEQSLYRSIAPNPTEEIKVQPSDYLVNHVFSINYLPRNSLTVYEDHEKNHFQSEFLLPSWLVPSTRLKLDTVRIELDGDM